MSDPYTVEVDCEGCEKCGLGRMWTVVGPDGVAHHTSFGEIDDAETLASDLNAAFEAGAAFGAKAVS